MVNFENFNSQKFIMKLAINFFKIIFTISLALMLVSWGYQGHYKISGESKQSFHEEMAEFLDWANVLAAHASDADDRKDIDPNEGPRHYIDIDNYPVFLEEGRIPQSYDSVVAIYGEAFVIEQGVLPWATKTAYDSLVSCFQRRDWNKAGLFAADLGHYVADGHMPLHITMNYNGQFTGNTGIHSRYESTMINAYISQINYLGHQISAISDVNNYIFDYLYNNYIYVDSVLLADDYAKELSGGSTSSTVYKEALWNNTKNFTVPLFSMASKRLAELIYSAWVEAGKPSLNASEIIEFSQPFFVLETNYPNPFSNTTSIHFSLKKKSEVKLKVFDASGKMLEQIANETFPAGDYHFQWNASMSTEGIYYLVMECFNQRQIKKMVVVR
jgi:hypothetical protein